MPQSPLTDIFPYLSDLRRFTNFIAKGPKNALNHSDLLGTIAKIMHNDNFSVNEYPDWSAQTWTIHIRDASKRRKYTGFLKEDGRSMGLRSAMIKHMEVAAEAHLMNAIFDAPIRCARQSSASSQEMDRGIQPSRDPGGPSEIRHRWPFVLQSQ